MAQQRKPAKTERNTDPDLCRRCGRCCYAKIVVDSEIVYTPYPCRYLDRQTRLCTVYDRRFEVNPDCLSVEQGIRLRVFPADCPYVQGLKNYRPPREHWTTEERILFGYLVRQMDNVDPDHADDGGGDELGEVQATAGKDKNT